MRIEDLAAQAVRRALAEHAEGDVLVFLPGAGEIRRVQERLPDLAVDILPLHGSLPQHEQDAAITPADNGRRKVVLSTDIAETSLTIEGVRIVIDSGLTRVPRFSPRSGMTTLVTLSVSKASADQRRGRAGRLGPGVCFRLWSRLDQQHLDAYSPPEIANADLAPLALELARWGTSDPSDLRWLDPPTDAAFSQARELLRELGALDSAGAITDHGLDMVEMGLHPRIAHLVLSGITLGLGELACEIAALLSERDIFHLDGGVVTVDLRPRLQALRDAQSEKSTGSSHSRGFHLNVGAARRVSQLADHFRRKLGFRDRKDDDIEAAGLLLAFAYPDRIAQLKPGQEGRFRLRTGRSAILKEPQPISGSEFIVAAALDGRAAESRIFIAAPVAKEDLEDHFRDHVDVVHRVYWENGVVRAREQHVIDALILKDGPLHDPDPDLLLDALLDGIRSEGLDMLPWSQEARRLQERLEFMHFSDPEWPTASDPCLLETLEDWLRPHLYGIKRIEELQRLDLTGILLSHLTWERRRELDERAPTYLKVPSGSKIPISYTDPSSPVLAVRLQEMFGLTETPRIDRGRVPLTLHLLSPAHRPVQVTQDLVSFWRDAYFDVRKDMRGRYPKHYWPENPLDAPPTNRAKPRS
jgi:ATP-dependent helicase HrpB